MPPQSSRSSKPKTFDAYLAALPDDQRAALEALRTAIHAAAPAMEECISYGLPAFRLNGKFLLALGAAAKHCALHLGSTVQTHPKELASFDTSKGTIRFQPHRPLPAALVRKLVRARITEKGFMKKTRPEPVALDGPHRRDPRRRV